MPRKKKIDFTAIVKGQIGAMHITLFEKLRECAERRASSWPWSVEYTGHQQHGYCNTMNVVCSYGTNEHDLATLRITVITKIADWAADDFFVPKVKAPVKRTSMKDERAWKLGAYIRDRTAIETVISIVSRERTAAELLGYSRRLTELSQLGVDLEVIGTRWLVPGCIGQPFFDAIKEAL